MDHLPQPSSPILPPVKVLFYCKNEDLFNNDDDFVSFPEQHAWTKQDLRELNFGERLLDSALSVIQSWLFFGVLKSIITVPFAIDDFCLTDEAGLKRITTSTLPDLINQWKSQTVPKDEEIAKLTSEEKKEQYEKTVQQAGRIKLILEVANQALVSMSFAVLKTNLIPAELLLSIEVLLSGISNCAIQIYGLGYVPSVGSAAKIDFGSLGMFRDWCPFLLNRMKAILNNSALYFAGRTEHYTSARLHQGCTDIKCSSERVDQCDYQTSHCCTSQACDMEGPDIDEVHTILDEDDYPILLFELDQKGFISLKVERAGKAPPYIAISHVWAHGLGNPKRNEMPVCQLKRLYRICQKWATTGKQVAIWIDTLLCPLEGKYCELAIAKMVPTYRKAVAVVVVDEGISRVTTKTPAIEILFHVTASMWMQRLWTLQEGALNSTVILQLVDGQIDLDELIQKFGDETLTTTCYETVSRDLFNACHAMRLLGIPATARPNPDFSFWVNMLQYRKTSEAPDESLCLATLLGHDLAKIVSLKPEQRLVEIYAAQRLLPANIIFLTHTKMAEDGMKWAPRSYLETGQGYGGTLVSVPHHSCGCFLRDIGLIIDLPAYAFQCETVRLPMMFKEPRSGFVFIAASAPAEAKVQLTPQNLKHWTGIFYLLFETRSENTSGKTAVAVLGSYEKHIQPTPEMSAEITGLREPNRDIRKIHYVQQVIIGYEPRFGNRSDLSDVSQIIKAVMPTCRVSLV